MNFDDVLYASFLLLSMIETDISPKPIELRFNDPLVPIRVCFRSHSRNELIQHFYPRLCVNRLII